MPELGELAVHKLPPHNTEAEQYVLGACIKSNEVFARALEIIEEDDFYKTANRKVFVAMRQLFEANEMIDALTLAERLRKNGALDAAGGMEYLDFLDDLSPTATALAHHAKILREKKILRDLIQTATEIATQSYDGGEEVGEILDRAEKSIFDIAEKKTQKTFFSIQDVIKGSFEWIEKLFEKPGYVTGVETGFTDFDRLTAGLQPSDLIIIAGRPSMGKTSFALDIACFAALHKQVPVAVFSLEMSKEQIGMRLLCAEAGVSSEKVRTGFIAKADWPRLTAAGGRLAEAPVFVDDTAALSVLQVRARARRLYSEKKIGLVVVDYLQLMQSDAGARSESRQLEVSEISRGLKALAKELNVPVVALSQLSRAVESRTDKRPMLSDLRESGSIEQDADVVAFIYRDEVYNPDSAEKGVAEVLIRKQRNGPTGEVKLMFKKEYTRFCNFSPLEEEPPFIPAVNDDDPPPF